MKIIKTHCLLILLFVSSSLFADDVDIVKKNYIQTLIYKDNSEKILASLRSMPKEAETSDQMVVELNQRYAPRKDETERMIQSQQTDGSWKDINYADKKRSGWEPKEHAERVLEMAKVYSSPVAGLHKSPILAEAIHKGLAFWFKQKLVCPNWWYNQIGVPKTLGAAFILFEDQLTPEEKEEAILVMRNSKFGMTGQNKVWLAGNVLVRALLQQDKALIKEARDIIASEIITGQPEGIKADCSFHQHGPQQQFGNYGAAYISGMASWSSIFAGTDFAFTQPQLNILSTLINNGYRRILWKGYMDVNGLGRQFFKNAQRHKAFTTAFSAVELAKADQQNRSQYEALLAENFSSENPRNELSGVYHFWQSDLTIQRRPQWMASVKMSSHRVIGSETVNNDNMKGYYLADGALYTYVDGDEYTNIFPCWDWRKIPGITSYETSAPLKSISGEGYRNNSDFVGNVNDQKNGITAMILNREGINAHKAWIFTDQYVLCLGSAITADSGCVVATSVEQRRQKGELLQLAGKKWKTVKQSNITPSHKEQRFFHDKTGYILLQPCTGTASTETRTGEWREVMQMYNPGSVQEDVFSIWLNHGKDPVNASYQYLILPASTPDNVKAFNTKSFRVIENSKNIQAISMENNKTFYIAVYTEADIKLSSKIHFRTKTPGLFLIKTEKGKTSVTVSDPTQSASSITFSINEQQHQVELPSGEMKGTSTYQSEII